MSRALKAIGYLLVSGGIGVALFAVCKPSQREIEQIRNIDFTKQTRVIQRAADSKEPIYRKSPKEIQQMMNKNNN